MSGYKQYLGNKCSDNYLKNIRRRRKLYDRKKIKNNNVLNESVYNNDIIYIDNNDCDFNINGNESDSDEKCDRADEHFK